MKILTLLFLLQLFPSDYSAENSSKKNQSQVKVTVSTKGESHSITETKLLNQFHYFWSQKQPITSSKSLTFRWLYQFVIGEGSGKSSWVYDPRGYAKKVTLKDSSVVFRLSSTRSFNRFLKRDQ